MPETTPDLASKSGLSENAAGAIAYITFIPAILFLILQPFNRNAYVRFHSLQSLLLCGAAAVINIALSIVLAFAPFLHFALWGLIQLCWLIVWLVCIVNAATGKRFKLPIIGPIAEQQSMR